MIATTYPDRIGVTQPQRSRSLMTEHRRWQERQAPRWPIVRFRNLYRLHDGIYGPTEIHGRDEAIRQYDATVRQLIRAGYSLIRTWESWVDGYYLGSTLLLCPGYGTRTVHLTPARADTF